MENSYNRLIEKNNYKKIICIGIECLDIGRSFPDVMKEFIFKALLRSEKVLIFTDDILYNDLEKLFSEYKYLVTNNINSGNLCIKIYDINKFRGTYSGFLDILSTTARTGEKLWVIWDFKNISRKAEDIRVIESYVEDIFSYSNANVYNLVYINNSKYNHKDYREFLMKFDVLFVKDKDLEIPFQCREEIDNAMWGLRLNSQIKYESNSLILFNNMFSNIPKSLNKDEFKNVIMNKLKNICSMDFCIIYNLSMEKNNILGLDSHYDIRKKHKYSLLNNRSIIDCQIKFNKKINNSGSAMIISNDDVENKEIKTYLDECEIECCVGVPVEYCDSAKGSIWLGRYNSKGKISKINLDYIQSVCKTAFYLMQEQNRFLELQNKLIENEKLRAMGEMAAGIAHDINNILTPIVGCIQLLKDSVKDRNILRQLKIVEICAYDGMNITNKVKKFARQYNNKDKLEIFDIDDLLMDAVELTKNKWVTESFTKGIKINVNISLNSKAKVKGNQTELREVFVNIISNAIDAISNDGKIEIESEIKNKVVNIKISDNGMGMSERVIKRVFEPFFTTKGSKGSGLGLSVSYKIIQSHGGSIDIDSQENLGTCFQIELPIYDGVIESDHKDMKQKISFNGSILIIDDQQQIRNVIADMMKSITNCKVKSCGCENIVSELKRRKYDIVLCDFSMPEMNGLKVAQILKEIHKDAYFCLMTGWVGSFDENNMKNVDFILNKPISKEKIKELFINYMTE